ncbi:hypothetical protein FACS1894216_07140 [Synergistales bacterium]|nr:hypothetical protein FACS1894216_07140 [Synergistales bacterium]
MIETMLAVLLLGLVVTASLKLVTISERGLRDVRIKEDLLRSANTYMSEAVIHPDEKSGTSNDVSWKIEEKKIEGLQFDGKLDLKELNLTGVYESLPTSANTDAITGKNREWRELEIKKGNSIIKLFLPPENTAPRLAVSNDSAGGSGTSGDTK